MSSHVAIAESGPRPSGFHLRASFIRDYMAGAAFIALLTTVWPYESPSRLLTVAAGLSAFTLGFVLILWGWHNGFIHSVSTWTAAFCGKITLSCLILILFWVGPMSPDLYRTPEGNHLDMIFYDYHAAFLATNGWQDAAEHLNFTWLSFGVVGYAAVIYSVFGVSILHVALFNAVLSLAGIIALTAGLNLLSGTRGHWQAMCLTLFFPYASYFDAIISKDVICNAFFYVGFLFLIRTYLAPPKKQPYHYALLALATGVMALVRVNLAMLFLSSACALALLKGALSRIILILALGAFALAAFSVIRPDAAQVIGHILDPAEFFDSQRMFVERVTAEGASPLKVKVAQLTIPNSLPSLVMFSPIRLLLWLYNPYPEILPTNIDPGAVSELYQNDPEGFAGSGHVLGAILSTWFICLETPFLLVFLNNRLCRSQRGWIILTILIFVPAFLIANLSYVGGKRYRLLIEPLLFAASLWAARYGKPSRYLLPTYGLILLPLAAYACITFFR